MERIGNFVEWGLERVKKSFVPAGAVLYIPLVRVGSVDQWEYLFGTTAKKCSAALIEERYNNYYRLKGWTRSDYNDATKNFIGKTVCDCNGVLDAFRHEDKNTDYTYNNYCTDKGEISKIERVFVIGEAVFVKGSSKMNHIGWVCGFMPDGTPLIMEERGIRYGFVITKLSERTFTHRGLMSKIFDYSAPNAPVEPVILKVTSPLMELEGIEVLQTAFNLLGYTDDNNNSLVIDGKCGKLTMQVVKKFANAHADTPAQESAEHTISVSYDGVKAMEVRVK